MTGHYILADVTSHKRGFGVRSIIDAVTRRAINAGDPSDGVLWIKPSHLTHFPLSANTLISDDAGTTWELLTKQITEIRAASPSREIVIVTWDHLIYDRAKNFGSTGVTGVKWFDWLEEDRGLRVADRQPAPVATVLKPSSTLPPVDHLIDLVAQYLISVQANSQGTSIYRSQLRPALIKAFPELAVASSSPFFAQSLKAALDVAIDTGRFAESRLSPGRERLWLVEPRIVEQTLQVEAEAVEAAKETTQPKTIPVFGRSAEFRKRLTNQGIYCEKRERDILVDALARTLKDRPSTISRLRRELPKTAIALAAERGTCAGVDFLRITNFFLKLCLVAGLLKNEDGNVIVRNAGADATKVFGLVDEPLEIAETYLLEQVMKQSDVQDREQWQLALTLFREFDQSVPLDDKLDRIAVLIARLGSLIVLTDDGTYDYTQNLPVTSSNVRAMRA